jgi:hypothetical protein
MIEKTVKCSYNYKEPKKQPSNLALDLIDDARKRKQLQKDRKKYNLNDEHVKIIERDDIEFEVVKIDRNMCVSKDRSEKCLFWGVTDHCSKPDNCTFLQKNKIFKQIHKTPSSFNKSLESESVEEPFENVADVVDEVLEDEKKTTVKIDTSKIAKAFEENRGEVEKSLNDAVKKFGEKLKHTGRVFNLDEKPISKYHTPFYSMSEDKTVVLDVYDMVDSLDLPNEEIVHTFKKIVRGGKGAKSLLDDLKEAYVQLGMGIKRLERKK